MHDEDARVMRVARVARTDSALAAIRHLSSLVALGTSLLVTAWGCDAVGYPAIEVRLQDRATGEPLSIGGTTFRYEGGQQPPSQLTIPSEVSASTFTICCTPGQWAVHVAKSGYAPFDTSVRVRSRGRCERPVLVQLLARLQRVPTAAAIRPAVPTVSRGAANDAHVARRHDS